MREEKDEQNYAKLSDQTDYQLKYQTSEAEGECIILSITPIKFITWRFFIYLIANLILFIPLLLTYWNQKYKRMFYMQFCSVQQATHFYILNYDEQISIVKKDRRSFMLTENKRKQYVCFVNRYMKYYLDENLIVRLAIYDYFGRIKQIANGDLESCGLDQLQAQQLKQTYGPGTMVINKPTIWQLIVLELVRPLYIFLLFSVSFWAFGEQYYYFAGTLFFVFVVGVVINLIQMAQLNNKIFSMAFYQIKLNVLRSGSVQKVSSLDVVPGDIVFLKDPIKIPFQGIILEGSALINECALTGQSVPVVKKADRLDQLANNSENIDKNAFVFQGTTIIQVSDKKKMAIFEQYRLQYGIPVCVTKTNFVTTKGQLIRIILFPKQQQNSFQKQSAKFLCFLFVISVLTYVDIIILNYEYQSIEDILMKFIDLILISVPPALPVSMTFGIIYAVQRLQKKKIFCISQNKVIVGGSIQLCCFDKTGTLTEDFMDFYCVVPAHNAKFHTQVVNSEDMSKYITDNVDNKPYYMPILNNIASNHSITKIEATHQLIGDPMEIKLLQFGHFQLNQTHVEHDAIFSFQSNRGHKGIVYRRFQFQSQLQRMSVVAKSNLSTNFEVFAKGSPQMMKTIMKNSSIPKNYDHILKEYASHGFRVLAIASKPITEQEMKNLGRQQIQKGLIFNGFEVFENKLKPQTKKAIQQLKQAEIDCVMITGDNTLTGSNISFKCSISDKRKHMIIIDYVGGRLTEQNFIFHDYDNTKAFPADKPIAQSYIEDDVRVSLMSKQKKSQRRSSLRDISQSEYFQPIKDTHEQFMFNMTVKAQQMNCQLCVTGRAFNELFSIAVTDITMIHKKFMQQVTVFARTKPNDKARIVMVFQQMGKKVSMCGDGANDCGALKQADIGLSLSQAQASISAPFTSQMTHIGSMVELMKQCRAGLATNFSLFNIMAIYSLIQYTSTIIEQRYLQYPADFQFLYWDICMNFLMIIFIGYTATADKLSIQKPRNSLFSLTNLIQMIVMFAIQFAGQIASIIIFMNIVPSYYSQFGGLDNARSFYEQNEQFSMQGVQSNAIFLFTNNIYLFSVLAFNISSPWRKQFYYNIPLMIIAVITLTYNILLIFVQAFDWEEFYLIHIGNDKLRLGIFLGSLAFGLFMYINQKCIMEPLSYKLIKRFPKTTWL